MLKGVGAAAGIGFVAGCTGDVTEEEPTDEPDGESVDDSDDDTDAETSFPEDDLHLIIPHGPGGGYDEYARMVAPYLADYLPGDVNVQVQNIDGAGGQIAAEQVYNEDPDGHTLLIVNAANFSITQLTEDVDFDVREYTYYARIARDYWGTAVGTNTDVHTWDDFVTGVQNEEIRFAASGPTSTDLMTPAVTGLLTDLYPVENVLDGLVTYSGKSEGIQGIMAGDVESMCSTLSSLLPYIESGDLRMIAINAMLEDSPDYFPVETETFQTLDVPNGDAVENALVHGRMFAGPPDTPTEHASILRDAFEQAIHDDDFRAEMDEADRPVLYADGETAQQEMVGMIDTWQDNDELMSLLQQ